MICSFVPSKSQLMISIFSVIVLAWLTHQQLNSTCENTPFWDIGQCRTNCLTCDSKGDCLTCPNYFSLNGTQCSLSESEAYNDIFFNQTELTAAILSNNSFKLDQITVLQESDIVRICKADSYKFDMLGMFTQSQQIDYSFTFDSAVTEIQIRFSFLTLFKNTKVEIVLNSEEVFDQTFTLSDLNHTYEPANSTVSISYLSIPSLTESSSSFLVQTVDTGIKTIDSDQYRIEHQMQIQVTYEDDPTNTSAFWAFSDLSIVGTKCQNCISDDLNQLSQNVGIAIGITAGIYRLITATLMLSRAQFYEIEFQKRKNLSFLCLVYSKFSFRLFKCESRILQYMNFLLILIILIAILYLCVILEEKSRKKAFAESHNKKVSEKEDDQMSLEQDQKDKNS